MSESVKVVNGGGIGFFGLLGVVFITLKLCGVITWSWWLVTLPLWGGVALLLSLVLLALLFVAIAAGIAAYLEHKESAK